MRGQRVNLAEIETSILTKIPIEERVKIRDSKVLVVGKNTHFQTIVAFYTSLGEYSSELQIQINKSLREILPPYMVPKLHHCNSFPTLVNGKVDRQKLIQSYESSLAFEATYTDEELNDYGCTNQQFYGKARVILNAVSATLGTRIMTNYCRTMYQILIIRNRNKL